MNWVLADSGFLVALLDRSERQHRQCAEAIFQRNTSLVTCEAVIAESCYLLRKMKGAQAALLENLERGTIQIPYHLAERADQVRKIIEKYENVPASLADACLIDLATALRCGRILTLDRDFQIYRWGKNRPFEIMVDLAGL